jgi:hypothetical protein
MFIKKDLRNIPSILADAKKNDSNDDGPETAATLLTVLSLQRRNAEFNANIRILCQPSNAPH